MTKLVKTYIAEIKGVNEKEMTVDVIVSTKTKDRDGDVVQPEAFKRSLSTYKKNPVLLSSHAHDSLQNVIGKAERIRVTDEGLNAKFKYFSGEGNAEADWAFKLASKGVGAFSVGFIGKKWNDIEDKDIFGGREFTEVELLEISQVTIPSNPDATIRNSFNSEEEEVYELACKAFGWNKKEVKEEMTNEEAQELVDNEEAEIPAEAVVSEEEVEEEEKNVKIEALEKRVDELEGIVGELLHDKDIEKSWLETLFDEKSEEENDFTGFSSDDIRKAIKG